jgi:hypothetical protein
MQTIMMHTPSGGVQMPQLSLQLYSPGPQTVCRFCRLDELALRANPLEEPDDLQIEVDDRIDGGPAALCTERSRPIAREAQVAPEV